MYVFPLHRWELDCVLTNPVDYLNSYMHPQAIIVDGSDAENPAFLAAMRF